MTSDKNAGVDKSEEALRLHKSYRGKVQIMPKCPVRSFDDFAVWYTPGVAAPSRAIAARRELVFDYTNRGNTVAIVSDGSRVLGLGGIGPEAAMPVMEGKSLLFKYLGGVDAVPICLNCRSPEEITATVRALAPTFGGINLEDIATPKCFRILEALRTTLPIPVWHDDQQGTATVVLAGLLNALEIVGKTLPKLKIALIGIGAANMAVYRLLVAEGAEPSSIVACDSQGTLHKYRGDIEAEGGALREKWEICRQTNGDNIVGGIKEALRGADVCLAFSRTGPGTITADAIKAMAQDAIVFACANPVPEIFPDEARSAGARIVATGRSDLPNQVNNSLAFPGVFRGVLDVRATSITDKMVRAGAHALAAYESTLSLSDDTILPRIDDMAAAATIAAAVGMEAQREGLAALTRTHQELFEGAMQRIVAGRKAHDALLANGCITAE
jgi:malate dehydrogenase (oxaloacetate-decarboxylating)